MVINTMVFMITGEYKEECGTCALIAEGSTMPYSDNTCPQVTPHKHALDIKLQTWPRTGVYIIPKN